MATIVSTSALCGIPECTRTCYEAGGIVHDYCGRTHAAEAVSRGLLASLRRPHGHCQVCKLDGCSEQVFFDSATSRVHDFCSKRHANQAKAQGKWNPPPGTAGATKCKLPGCPRGVYVDAVHNVESDFCSQGHRAEAKKRECLRKSCTSPAWLANVDGPQYCSSRCSILEGGQPAHASGRSGLCALAGCSEIALHHRPTGTVLGYCCEGHRVRQEQRSTGVADANPYVERVFHGGIIGSTNFKLSVLSKAHPEYSSLRDQFTSKWVKPEPVGGVSVEKILKVEVPADVRRKAQEYEKAVGNIRRRFHGTACSAQCSFFVDLKGEPCGNKDCSVCSICTQGFAMQGNAGRTARATGIDLRYGEGLYFSSVSGKANDYAGLSEKTAKDGTKLRAMFVANVTAGKAYTTQEDGLDKDMCPPDGFDSVVGEVGKGLNFDEIVVYKNEAALPTHLIVYALH